MTPEQAVPRLQEILAHAWMVRTFLKHSDEIQDDEDLLDVPRTVFDFIRAVEPAFQRGDWLDYVRRLRGKLPKLRRVAEYLTANWQRVSVHTNFEMATASLSACVRQLAEILDKVDWQAPESSAQPESGS